MYRFSVHNCTSENSLAKRIQLWKYSFPWNSAEVLFCLDSSSIIWVHDVDTRVNFKYFNSVSNKFSSLRHSTRLGNYYYSNIFVVLKIIYSTWLEQTNKPTSWSLGTKPGLLFLLPQDDSVINIFAFRRNQQLCNLSFNKSSSFHIKVSYHTNDVF